MKHFADIMMKNNYYKILVAIMEIIMRVLKTGKSMSAKRKKLDFFAWIVCFENCGLDRSSCPVESEAEHFFVKFNSK